MSILETAKQVVALSASIGPGDLSTSEKIILDETIDCPACNGVGDVDVDTYVNFDDRAVGVQFYGVGPDFGRYEKLYEYGIKTAPALAAALVEASDIAKAYEQWEADLVMHGDWSDAMPKLTQELYDQMMILQAKRNAFLSRISKDHPNV